MCERFQMKNLKIIASTSIVVLSIQFKPFEVFVGPRSSSHRKIDCIDNEEYIIYLLPELVQNK